ncbi:MAG: ABC transporter ATP-binding protein [Nocardioides sp.]
MTDTEGTEGTARATGTAGGGDLLVGGLTVRFGEVEAVRHVDFRLGSGEVLTVLGPSGCGKSTLLRAIAGLEPVSAGQVRFGGVDLTRMPAHLRGFALMFQDGQLFDHLSVAGNVAYPLRIRRTPRARRDARVAELLELVRLPGYGERDPATLSGGERQRVALARALAVPPRLLLLDEPLSALDGGLRDRLAGDLREILSASATTAICVTHDHEDAFALGDRMAVMRAGRVLQDGPITEVWRHPRDPETALLLGYAAVLVGERARILLAAARVGDHPAGPSTAGRPAGAGEVGVALRRSALYAAADGPLRGTVISARQTPDRVRLVVRVEGLGELDAVASGLPIPGGSTCDPGADEAPMVGSVIGIGVDSTRLAILSLQ